MLKSFISPLDILPSDDDFLRIFLPIIDDEERRRELEELESEEDKADIDNDLDDGLEENLDDDIDKNEGDQDE